MELPNIDDLKQKGQATPVPAPPALAEAAFAERPYTPDQDREETRAILARWLILLLGFTVGGALFFIGFGRLDGAVLVQSIFPALIALVGTALGFYFGTQTPQTGPNSGPNVNAPNPMSPPPPPTPQIIPPPPPEGGKNG